MSPNLTQTIQELENIASVYTCDGACDEKPPYQPCPECAAKQSLNHLQDWAMQELSHIRKIR